MPAGATAALQTGNPALGTVSRRPQTSAVQEQANVPFVRLSRMAGIPAFNSAGNAFGALVPGTILKAAGGYLRGLRLRISAVGGTSTGAVVAAADAPWNVVSSGIGRGSKMC